MAGSSADDASRPGACEGAAESLSVAYERQTTQLHEARGALAEAVAALTIELEQRRERIQALEEELCAMQEVVDVLRNMKAVRWTVWPRRIVYRLRSGERSR